MKASLKYIALALILGVTALFSCNNELDITDDWKEVAVVYGLLNPADTMHYVKINKAFLGDEDAYIMAANPDSTYFHDGIEVLIEEIHENGWVERTFMLDTTWIHNKEDGVFPSPDQKLYSFNGVLKQDRSYRLVINNPKTGNKVQAQTNLVDDIKIEVPRPSQSFYSSFVTTNDARVEFRSAKNGRVYQLVIRFHYYEVNVNTNDSVPKYVDWEFPNKKSPDLNGGDKMIYLFPGRSFFANLDAQIEADQFVKRYAGDVEFIVYAGGDELSTYIDITSPLNSIVQERPEYSNVSNGIGIFSSRFHKSKACRLSPQTLDTLISGSYTYDLGFQQ